MRLDDLQKLDEKLNTRMIDRLANYIFDQLKREAESELKGQEFSKNALKTRISALHSELNNTLSLKVQVGRK